MSDYLPLLFMLALATVFAGASFFVSTTIFSTQRPTAAKSAPYESGIVPSREPAQRFPVALVNVQVEYFVRASGGAIVTRLADVPRALKGVRRRPSAGASSSRRIR